MKAVRFSILLIFLCLVTLPLPAQTVSDIEGMELSYKACLKSAVDTSGCGKFFLRQMDSILTVVSEKVRLQLSAKEKADYLKEQQSWAAKRSEFNKKQDDNFTFNLQEGTWKPNMIWLVYENKADYLKKRALTLTKRLQ